MAETLPFYTELGAAWVHAARAAAAGDRRRAIDTLLPCGLAPAVAGARLRGFLAFGPGAAAGQVLMAHPGGDPDQQRERVFTAAADIASRARSEPARVRDDACALLGAALDEETAECLTIAGHLAARDQQHASRVMIVLLTVYVGAGGGRVGPEPAR